MMSLVNEKINVIYSYMRLLTRAFQRNCTNNRRFSKTLSVNIRLSADIHL